MSRGGQFVVVLCEDETSFNFASSLLKLTGIIQTRGQIKDVICPKGSGSGEQFVRLNLPKELQWNRRRNRIGTFTLLIVITDADTHTLHERKQQLRAACESSVLTSADGYIRDNEPAAVLIPKRNIETWLRLLDGQQVDETTQYRHGRGTQRCESQVGTLFTHCQQQTEPRNAVDSLRAACGEYHRVLPLMPRP